LREQLAQRLCSP